MSNKQTYEEAVLKTVMWWSDKAFRTPLNQNNGDDSHQGSMIFMLQNMVSTKAQDTATPEKIKKFENKLTELLMNKSGYEVILDVDYHPCELLATAATFAGIDTGCFPCKSYTTITKSNEVFAKYQYGNSAVKI